VRNSAICSSIHTDLQTSLLRSQSYSSTPTGLPATPKVSLRLLQVSLRHVQMFLWHPRSLCDMCRCFYDTQGLSATRTGVLRLWRLRWHVPPKPWLTFSGLPGVISQNIELFITTGVRISNPAQSLKCTCESSVAQLRVLSLSVSWRAVWMGLEVTLHQNEFQYFLTSPRTRSHVVNHKIDNSNGEGREHCMGQEIGYLKLNIGLT
jgi:hypothetical protein